MPQNPRDYVTSRIPTRLASAVGKILEVRGQMEMVNSGSSFPHYSQDAMEVLDECAERIKELARNLQSLEHEVAEETRRWKTERAAEKLGASTLPVAAVQQLIQRKLQHG